MAIMNGTTHRAPSRSASFQKMLELEKKYKLERLQNISRPPPTQRLPPSTAQSHNHQQPPSSSSPPRLQPQELEKQHPSSPPDERLPEPEFSQKDQRSSSFSQEQNLLMLKAVRRSVALPSLSISIPPAPNATKEESPKRKAVPPPQQRSMSDGDQTVTKSGGGSQQKSVSFLAPDDSDVSDEESICQSPTWEGYREGEKKVKQRKKQKKRDKEQAANDARIARKRLTARLSKMQPGSKESSPAPFGRKLLRSVTEPLSIEYPQDSSSGDAQYALAKLTGQPYQPSGKRPPSRGTNSFAGGIKLATQSEDTARRVAEARERAIERDQAAAVDPRAVQPKPFSITPGSLPRLGRKTPTSPPDPTKEKEKEKAPARPSMSLTNIFRPGRSSTMLTSQTEANASDQEAFPEPNRNQVVPHNRSTPALLNRTMAPPIMPEVRGRPGSAGTNSYVKSSREQSTERAITGFKDELKVSGFFHRFRASSQALKPPATQPNANIRTTIDDAVTDWPPPPKVSSPTGSERSSKSSPRQDSGNRSQAHLTPTPASPTFSFTSNMTSYFEHQPLTGQIVQTPDSTPTSSTVPKIPEMAKTPTLATEFRQATQAPSHVPGVAIASQSFDNQGGSRTSERSSASSYADSHDISPPVSPATTPDTSRPQSQKGGMPAPAKLNEDAAAATDSDTEGSLPEVFHAINFDNIETPHDDGKSQSSGSKSSKDSDDSWSRSAMPIEVDQQSVMTNISNLNLNDAGRSKSSLSQRPPISTTTGQTSMTFEDAQESVTGPEQKDVPAQDDGSLPNGQFRKAPNSSRQGDVSFLPPLKHQSLGPPSKGKTGLKAESRIFPVVATPRENRSRSMSPAPSSISKTETLKSEESETSTGPASYLQEARKSTQAPPPTNALRPIHRGQLRASNLRNSSMVGRGSLPDKPIAKMFVECCHCKFYHDMPSRVYECMVSPDSFVEDKRLGVSGAITTMVKCPWCAHNMSKECCAGYMALVMLQQKLH